MDLTCHGLLPSIENQYIVNFGQDYMLLVATIALLSLAVPAFCVTFDVIGLDDPNIRARVDSDYQRRGSVGKHHYGVNVQIIGTSLVYLPRITGFAFNLPVAVTGVDHGLSLLKNWFAQTNPDADTPQ